MATLDSLNQLLTLEKETAERYKKLASFVCNDSFMLQTIQELLNQSNTKAEILENTINQIQSARYGIIIFPEEPWL